MPIAPRRPPQLAHKIFRGSRAIERGWLSRSELRSLAWQRLFHDVYADARLERTHRLLCRAAQSFLLPEDAVIAGRSAAHLFGVPFVGGDDPVEVLTPRKFGPVSGMKIHVGALAPGDRSVHGRWRIATPLRTCWDVASWLEVAEAVAFADALAARDLVTGDMLERYGQQRKGAKGYVRFTKVLALMDRSAESAPESRLRVGLALGGITGLVTQFDIVRDGCFVARVDLALPEAKIAIEYDGRWHASTSQLERDRLRLNRLLGAEWIVFHVTADQLRGGLDELLRDLRAAIRSRTGHSRKLPPARP
jgi:very-short-patch-repair endonuclease